MSRNWADWGQGREEDFSRRIFLYLLILNDKMIILINIFSILGIFSWRWSELNSTGFSKSLFHFHNQSN